MVRPEKQMYHPSVMSIVSGLWSLVALTLGSMNVFGVMTAVLGKTPMEKKFTVYGNFYKGGGGAGHFHFL